MVVVVRLRLGVLVYLEIFWYLRFLVMIKVGVRSFGFISGLGVFDVVEGD